MKTLVLPENGLGRLTSREVFVALMDNLKLGQPLNYHSSD